MLSVEQFAHKIERADFIEFNMDEEEFSASAVIGPEGGMVAVIDPASPIYGTSLKIPAGALDSPVRISIREGSHSCAFGMGPSINLVPAGLNFKRFATLTVQIDTACTIDDNKAVPAVYQYDETINQWAHNSATRLERQDDTVLCDLLHL